MCNIKTPRFEQRHYEVIAEAMKQSRPESGTTMAMCIATGTWLHVVDDLISAFKADNPKFSSDKFKRACGIKE